MRVSVLASVCVGVLALVAAPALADISDLQCHSGNSNANGVCTPGQTPPEDFQPTYNKRDGVFNGISYETDRVYLKALLNTTTFATQGQFDALLDVHRIIWGTNTQNGVGNSQRNVSNTIGRVLPAGFLDFPFQMAYRADGFYLEPHPTQAGDYVTGTTFDFNYKLKDTSSQTGGINQPLLATNGYQETRMLFQPAGGFGFTAGSPMSTVGQYGQGDVFTDGNTMQFGPLGTLPNAGVGTYYLTRRVISTAGGEQLTGNLTVQSGTTLQSVGGANAPGNTYNVQAVQGAYDAPVLSNMVTPQADGAFVTFQLAPLAGATPATGKVFISQAILTVKSVTPVDGSTTGVPFVGTYTLDISSNNVATSTYVAGSQKLYVRATGSNTWTALSGSTLSNNQVSYTLQSSDVPAASAASLDMAVQADAPPPPVPSSSTGPSSSSSSSSTAPAVVSSSSSSTAPAVPSSSSAVPSSSSAAPSSSTAAPSSSTAAPAASSSSSSSTGAAAPRSSSSSSSTAAPVSPVVSSSSSSSSGAAFSSSSSSTAEDNGSDGGAASVAANGVAVVLAAAAAVAALYA